jgi:hypothetical protein
MGMFDEVKQRVFDYSFTTKAVGEGTGLGLAIAHQIIVEKHNGAIEVNSTLGVGTEFVITLPVKTHGRCSTFSAMRYARGAIARMRIEPTLLVNLCAFLPGLVWRSL